MIKLLVVDPHPIISKGLELIFNTTQEINFVGSVTDGEALFRFISESRVDLILMEIDLPKLNGITAVRRLKEEYPNIKVIIFSAQPEEVYAVSAIKAGADGYVQKTTDILTLKNAITSVYNDDKVYLSDTLNKRLSSNSKGIKNGTYYKKLSTREVEVLKLLASGRRNKEIAEELNINEKTVSTYRARLMKKLNVTNLVDLVHKANSLHL